MHFDVGQPQQGGSNRSVEILQDLPAERRAKGKLKAVLVQPLIVQTILSAAQVDVRKIGIKN